MPPLFIFCRHGQAEHNVGAELYGDIAYTSEKYLDAKLTDLGHSQTTEAGKMLAEIIGDKAVYLYSSPLSRCIQTAENIAKSIKNIESRTLHDSLLERLHYGHFCNDRKTPNQIQYHFPDWNTDVLPLFPPKWPNNEPLESTRLRMKSFLCFLQDLYKENNNVVLIVSHHDAIDSLFNVKLRNAEFFLHGNLYGVVNQTS